MLLHQFQKILILSGKGGVEKSTFTSLLAKNLSQQNVDSIFDLNLCGKSQPLLCKILLEEHLKETSFGFQPAYVSHNLSLDCSQFFLENIDQRIIESGPMKS
jgi:Mrp family chromosome partitioning ATPase